MTDASGDSTPVQIDTTSSPSALIKRKRSISTDDSNLRSTATVSKPPAAFPQRLLNALPLLRTADPAPSILNHSLALNGEPSPKRLKHDVQNPGPSSISSRIERKLYQTPEALLQDVDVAARSLAQEMETIATPADPGSVVKAVNRINLFKQSLSKVCRHIMSSEAKIKPEGSPGEDSLPGLKEEIKRPAVLTLTCQTDKGSKPLYSGLQRQSRETDIEMANIPQPTRLPSLDPRGLPNGLSATEVASSNVFEQNGVIKQKRTISEVFRPHRSLKSLEPPRPCRNASRGSSLGWANDTEQYGSEKPTPVYKSDHRYSSLPTGSWLHYYNPEAPTGHSLDSKRKKRDRALSFGESRADAAEEDMESEQAKSSALFQSAYSSFAPAVDNSTAVVSEKTRTSAWWNKSGSKRFQALLSLQYPGSEDGKLITTTCTEVDDTEDNFDAMIASFQEDAADNPMQQSLERKADPSEADGVLQEISDLLDTLSSHQRIRNLSKISHGPASPTSAESDVYEILRANLSILIESLPPYAVAKLDGHQLRVLNVSTSFVTDTKDHVGTLEVDESSIQRQRVPVAAIQSANNRNGALVSPARRQGSYNTPSMVHGQRAGFSGTPRTPQSNQPWAASSHGSTGQSPGRSRPLSSQRAGLSKPPQHSSRTYGAGTSTVPLPRPSQSVSNGYGTPYGSTNHYNSGAAHVLPRQAQPAVSYPTNRSPQIVGETPRSSLTSDVQQYTRKQRLSPAAVQASPSNAYSTIGPVTMTEQAKAQLQAHRQLASTPQRLNTNTNTRYAYGQGQQMAGASTSGGGTPNRCAPVIASEGGR